MDLPGNRTFLATLKSQKRPDSSPSLTDPTHSVITQPQPPILVAQTESRCPAASAGAVRCKAFRPLNLPSTLASVRRWNRSIWLEYLIDLEYTHGLHIHDRTNVYTYLLSFPRLEFSTQQSFTIATNFLASPTRVLCSSHPALTVGRTPPIFYPRAQNLNITPRC